MADRGRRHDGCPFLPDDPRPPVTMDHTLVRVSKRLAWALRHDPEAAGLVLDGQGWVAVPDVLAALGISRDVLDAVVVGNEKRRFGVRRDENGTEYIRRARGIRSRWNWGWIRCSHRRRSFTAPPRR